MSQPLVQTIILREFLIATYREGNPQIKRHNMYCCSGAIPAAIALVNTVTEGDIETALNAVESFSEDLIDDIVNRGEELLEAAEEAYDNLINPVEGVMKNITDALEAFSVMKMGVIGAKLKRRSLCFGNSNSCTIDHGIT